MRAWPPVQIYACNAKNTVIIRTVKNCYSCVLLKEKLWMKNIYRLKRKSSLRQVYLSCNQSRIWSRWSYLELMHWNDDKKKLTISNWKEPVNSSRNPFSHSVFTTTVIKDWKIHATETVPGIQKFYVFDDQVRSWLLVYQEYVMFDDFIANCIGEEELSVLLNATNRLENLPIVSMGGAGGL